MPQERSRLIGFKKRLGTFEEVHLGLNKAGAVENSKIFLEREQAVKGSACPLTDDYFTILKLLAANNVRAASAKLLESNPLPGVTSRLAPEIFIETQVYNRKADRISLRAIERFLADNFKGEPMKAPDVLVRSRTKVAVIGSGPAGLTAAALLNRKGYAVTIFESAAVAGGSLASFYPEFRLPAKALDLTVNRLSAEGVEFKFNLLFPRGLSVGELFEEGGFSAVLLATGAGLSGALSIPGENAAGVMAASQMLLYSRMMRAGRAPYTTPEFLGNKLIVVGHNEMAFDAARTAIRFGKSVVMVIAGAETDIRVPADMVREAAEEGVKFSTFAVPVRVNMDAAGCVKSLVCRHLDYRVDSAGRLTVVEQSDAEFELEADTVLVSREMRANTLFVAEIPGLDLNLDGSVWVKPDSSYTSVKKIFACGQVVRPGIPLLDIMVDARRSAIEIHNFLTS